MHFAMDTPGRRLSISRSGQVDANRTLRMAVKTFHCCPYRAFPEHLHGGNIEGENPLSRKTKHSKCRGTLGLRPYAAMG